MSHPLNTPIGRFGIDTFERTVAVPGGQQVTATLPAHGLRNPLTGRPTAAPLAMLLDHTGGLANHLRRDDGEWTVSTELSIELSPDAADLIAADETPVTARARPVGGKGPTAMVLCDFTIGDVVIGTGSVRSFYINASQFFDPPADPAHLVRKTGLAEMMAVEPDPSGGAVLRQLADPVLNNSLGVVHGGVAATGLELVASAAVNAGREDDPLRTGSLRVNYLRRLLAGGECRYTATALHVGRSTGVAEAQAFGADGKLALSARFTGYR
ncbi:PaaI family thioesterase [Mycolicibacterium sp. F2034L]|uniref:PaaI family thioesterase n=1 Tax=Mycolicibacterium sp. F2034L TaxID=2926422 RepID=UPI001FF6DDB8|nr:PaaI family thioesterase [Mycolicibacterium sp. F2034L]MCK0176197.1 PaaI family thioesterase [Mycolicibacterium sp. F2034L]